MSANISHLSATVVDDYDNTLGVQWDGRTLLLTIFPKGKSTGPTVVLQPAGLIEVHALLGLLPADEPKT